MEKRARFQSRWLPYALIAPQMAITLVFFFLPASQAIYQSLMVQDAFGNSTQFVWFENFQDLFRNDEYLASFRVTAVFSTLVAVLGLSISLLLAVLADRVLRGAAIYKTLLIWPYAVAPAVAGVLWLFLFNPTLGVVAHWLQGLGIPWDPLLDGTHALIMVVVAAVWKQISYNFLFFLAGLQSIPKSLIAAAAIDGAGPSRRFWTIVLPLLSPTAFFQTSGIIHAVTNGGPAKATEILVFKVYNDGFRGLDLGGSAAQSVVLMILVIALTVLQFRFIERRVHY